MKIVSILVLALALVALASTCIAFTPTSDDTAWKTAVINDSAVIKSDVDKMNKARLDMSIESIHKYSKQLAEDAGKALLKSQTYNVSTELQNAKDLYEQGLSSYKKGADRISTTLNPTRSNAGWVGVDRGRNDVDQATQEMTTIFSVSIQ